MGVMGYGQRGRRRDYPLTGNTFKGGDFLHICYPFFSKGYRHFGRDSTNLFLDPLLLLGYPGIFRVHLLWLPNYVDC